MNPLFRDRALARARAATDAVRCLGPDATSVALSGIIATELLRPLLPPDVAIGRGRVVTATGDCSALHQVVLYDAQGLPATVVDGEAVLPVEAVFCTVDVVACLDDAALAAADDRAMELLGFRHAPRLASAPSRRASDDVQRVLSCLLAFDSDQVGGIDAEVLRYDHTRAMRDPAIPLLAVAGRGTLRWTAHGWDEQPASGAGSEELVRFVATLASSCRRIAATRPRPDLEAYLFA
ncbi:MAG TPA: DUF6602 domain-containing protein [Gemmatimonadaceae bacterium]|jgi:hypothetical protein|nr:DUF6602 domain-containing protein [Gemmatimonadaceae bacterium]